MKTTNKLYMLLVLLCFQVFQTGAQSNNDTSLLTLKEALAITLDNNHDILMSQNDAEINENNAVPGNAGLFPSLDARGNYTEELNNTNIEFASPEQPPINRDNARSTSYNASLNFRYNVFGGLGKYYRFESLKNLNEIGNIRLRLTIENTLLAVYRSYFEVVSLTKRVRINGITLQISEERYNRLQKQYEFGSAGKLQLLNAKVDLNTDSINLERSKNELRNVSYNLNILMGREPEINFRVQTSLPEPSPVPSKSKMIDTALNQNARLLLARNQTENAVLQHKITRAGYYPRLDLTSSYGYNRMENEGSFFTNQETFGLSGGLTLSFDIFNGRQQAIKVQNAKIDINSREENETKIQQQVQRDILNYYETYTNNLLLLEMTNDDLETAQLNFEQSEKMLETGQISSTEYRAAQLNLRRTMLQQTQYEIQAKLSEIQLKKAAGLLMFKEK